MMAFLFVLAIAAAFLSALGQIFLKKYALARKRPGLFRFLHRYFLNSIASFVLAFAIAVYVMQTMEFTVYYAITSLNFVFVLLLSRRLLGEAVDLRKTIGILLIVAGLIVFNQ